MKETVGLVGAWLDHKLAADKIVADLCNLDAEHIIGATLIRSVYSCKVDRFLPYFHSVESFPILA